MILRAKLLGDRPHHIPDGSKPRRAKAREGVAYERYVHAILADLYGSRFVGNPWFEYTTENGVNWCSPDFLIMPTDLNKGTIVVGECKLTYKAKAWDKYRDLYKPVVSKVLAGYDLGAVQVCRHLKRGVRPSEFALGTLDEIDWKTVSKWVVVNHRP